MSSDPTCPLCGVALPLRGDGALLHVPVDGPARWARTCSTCEVLAVLPARTDEIATLLVHATVTSGPHAPWEGDDLGHDAVCIASARLPEHDVDAPPLCDDEVAALVARLDDLLEA